MVELVETLQSFRFPIHMVLHFAVPFFLSRFFKDSNRIFILLIATMLVDIDHLATTPITDPNRCSIGFHFLHAYWIQPFYVGLSFIPKTRWIGIGLVIHMLLDALDCYLMKL